MAKIPLALQAIPPAAVVGLQELGENLAIARVRRRESQRAWARRMGISVPTLIRMERGDPGVGAGIYATALWLIGKIEGLPELAEPSEDRGAPDKDIGKTRRRTARQAPAVNRVRGESGVKNTGRR